MGLKREVAKRAEGVGYYTTISGDAAEILDYLSGDLSHLEEERPYYGYDGKTFKVTITVEEE